MPHRAHVLRPHRRLPRDDPGRHARGPREGAGEAAAATSATDFAGIVPRDGGPAGHDPPARSAAARVPAARGRRAGRVGREDRHHAGGGRAAASHELHEFNPMLGHRGCRLGIVYPEITRMQARAIFEAACDVKAEGLDVHPGDHDPAGRLRSRSSATRRRSSARRPPRCSRRRPRRSTTWSAR